MIAVNKGMGVFFDGDVSELLNEYVNIVSGLYKILAKEYETNKVKKGILSITMDVLNDNLKEAKS